MTEYTETWEMPAGLTEGLDYEVAEGALTETPGYMQTPPPPSAFDPCEDCGARPGQPCKAPPGERCIALK
jgi:hypothetical protein